MANTQTPIAEVYSAFNQRNIDSALFVAGIDSQNLPSQNSSSPRRTN